MKKLTNTEEKTLYNIRNKFQKAMKEYNLVEDDDHILIGLSGGKDSLALVELLGERMKVHVPRFKVTAVHISLKNIAYQSNLAYLKTHCEKAGIEFVHKETAFETKNKRKKSTCFICSWTRRKTIFETAKEIGCNKIALGHHLDDIVETLLLNMIYQGSIQTMPPKLKMNKFEMTIIRPLALIREEELKEMERIKEYQKQIKNCPYEKESSRKNAKNLIIELEKWNPNVRSSLFSSMENIYAEYLPKKRRTNPNT